MPAESSSSFARLRRLGVIGALDRLRQEAGKRLDPVLARMGKTFCEEPREIGSAAQFFFAPGAAKQILREMELRHPSLAERILSRAEAVCRHEFDLLGYSKLRFQSGASSTIDWHFDPVSGKRAPLIAWHRVPYLDAGRLGDAKVTAELSRHQHFPVLAKAYLLSGEPRYLRELLAQFEDWQRQNPYPLGINWASSLEVAFRSMSWIWTLELLGNEPQMQQARPAWLRALSCNAQHIERYLSTTFSPNTHLQGEAAAMFFIGAMCPELPSAERWQQRGWELLIHHASQKVLADGAYYELSTHYHVYALDFFLHARILAWRNGIRIPTEFDQTLRRMLRWLAELSGDGAPPRLGDDDGGRVFDGLRNRAEHLADPLALGAALYRDSAYTGAFVHVTEELYWLLGVEGVDEFEQLQAAAPASKARMSYRAERSGIVVLPAGAWHAVADYGTLGGERGGHGHADALAVNVSFDGAPVFVDAGTGAYVGVARDRFRTTPAHNTLSLETEVGCRPAGPFAWRGTNEGEILTFAEGDGMSFCELSRKIAHEDRTAFVHLRQVFCTIDGLFVHDRLQDTNGSPVELSAGNAHIAWLLAEGITASFDEHGDAFRIKLAANRTLSLALAAPGWDASLQPAEMSPAYGEIIPTSRLHLENAKSQLCDVAQMLHHGEASFARANDPEQNLSVYAFTSPDKVLILFSATATWHWQDHRGNCRFAVAQYSLDGHLQKAFSAGGEFAPAPMHAPAAAQMARHS